MKKPPPSTVFVDESRRGRTYFVLAAIAANRDVNAHRSTLRTLLQPGQRSFHAKNESDSRRRQGLDLVAGLGVTVRIYRCRDLPSIGEPEARHRCLVQLVHDLDEINGRRIVIEQRQGQDQRDTDTLLNMKQRTGHTFEFGHLSPNVEPMLWPPDLVGWAHGRGGQWRNLVAGLSYVIDV